MEGCQRDVMGRQGKEATLNLFLWVWRWVILFSPLEKVRNSATSWTSSCLCQKCFLPPSSFTRQLQNPKASVSALGPCSWRGAWSIFAAKSFTACPQCPHNAEGWSSFRLQHDDRSLLLARLRIFPWFLLFQVHMIFILVCVSLGWTLVLEWTTQMLYC